MFRTKALAEWIMRAVSIQGHDAIAQSREYFRRLSKRGSECRLTTADKKAIARAGGRSVNSREIPPNWTPN